MHIPGTVIVILKFKKNVGQSKLTAVTGALFLIVKSCMQNFVQYKLKILLYVYKIYLKRKLKYFFLKQQTFN